MTPPQATKQRRIPAAIVLEILAVVAAVVAIGGLVQLCRAVSNDDPAFSQHIVTMAAGILAGAMLWAKASELTLLGKIAELNEKNALELKRNSQAIDSLGGNQRPKLSGMI